MASLTACLALFILPLQRRKSHLQYSATLLLATRSATVVAVSTAVPRLVSLNVRRSAARIQLIAFEPERLLIKMSKRNSLLVQQLISCSLDSTPLHDFLDKVVTAVVDTQEKLAKLTKRENDRFEKSSAQLDSLPQMRAELNTLLSNSQLFASAMEKIDAWSERFTMLEQRSYELTSEVYKRVEDIQKEVNVKAIEAEADLEQTAKRLRREWREQSEAQTRPEARSVCVQVETVQFVQRRSPTPPVRRSPTPPAQVVPAASPQRSLGQEVGSQVTPPQSPSPVLRVDIPPVSTFSATIATSPLVLSDAGPLTQIPEEVDPCLEETLRDLDARIALLERVFSEQNRRSPRKALSTLSKESSRAFDDQPLADFSQELRANHVAVLSELEDLRGICDQALVDKASLPEDTSLAPREDIPSEICFRLNRVEEEVGKLWQTREQALEQVAEMQETVVRRSELAAWTQDIERVKVLVAAVSEELTELSKEVKRPQDQSHMTSIQDAAKQISESIHQRIVLTDIGAAIHSKEKPAQKRVAAQPPMDTDSFKFLERQIQSFAHDIEKVKSAVASKAKELEEVEQHLERHERLTQDGVKRLQGEFAQKFETFQALLAKDPEDPEAGKSLVALRGFIVKLQKEVRELHSAVDKLSPAVLPESTLGDSDDSTRLKYISAAVQKHESTLRTQSAVVKQVAEDLEALQTVWRKQIETQAAVRAGEMEEFRSEIAVVLKKLEDGAKLSQRDVEKINELYEKVESKGDKAEVASKVDRTELQKAYKSLAKRIEQLQERHQPESGSPVAREEPAVTTRRLEPECLSCGKEVSAGSSPFRLPSQCSERRLNRFGHGFSKLLPMLNTLTSKDRHRRGVSEAVSQPSSSVEKTRHVRMKTHESERGLSTTRRQNSLIHDAP